MPRQSKTDHVKKICGCGKWKECAHPWYVDYREGSAKSAKGERTLRKKLALLVGREPVDFADAKAEARRAIVAWKDGRDARQVLPGDAPTLATVLDEYGKRPGGAPIDRFQRGPIVTTPINGRALGEWRASEVTRDMIEAFQRRRPKVAGNRDLALLRAMFNWAVLSGLVPSTPFKVGTVSAVKFSREEPRTRRFQPGEEERLLLAASGPQGSGRRRARDRMPPRRAPLAAVGSGPRRSVSAGGEDEGQEAAPRADLHGAQGRPGRAQERSGGGTLAGVSVRVWRRSGAAPRVD